MVLLRLHGIAAGMASALLRGLVACVLITWLWGQESPAPHANEPLTDESLEEPEHRCWCAVATRSGAGCAIAIASGRPWWLPSLPSSADDAHIVAAVYAQ